MDAIVIDHGTFEIRAGYANPDNDPQIIVSSEACLFEGYSPGASDFGTSLVPLRDEKGEITTRCPIQHGQIADWDVMEDVWRHIFYENLGWEMGNEGQVLVAEALNTPKGSRERLTQIMFETFNCSGLYTVEQALLSLFAVGRLSGCTVDIGHGKSEIVPIVDGAIQYPSAHVVPVGSADLDNHLLGHLSQSNPHAQISSRAVRAIREACCSVPLEAGSSEEATAAVEHTLPDGQVIVVGEERHRLPEAIFCPSVLGFLRSGLAEQMVQSVASCAPQEQQRALMDNVVLVGGGSLMAGFEARFLRDAAACAPPSLKPTLVKPPEYMPESTVKNAAWMGGAILAKVVFAQNQHVAKTDYDEWGPLVVHRKCS